MTERILPGIGLTGFWDQGAPWKVGGDQNWLLSSVLTQLSVESATTSLPASPLNGVIYIVPVGDANANQVAARDNGAWAYFPPQEGWTAYVRDTQVLMNFDGAAWVPSTTPLSTALAADDGPANLGFKRTAISGVIPVDLYRWLGSMPILDVEAGCVGDGIADDTLALNVLSAACKVAGQKAVGRPGAIYRVTGTVTFACHFDFGESTFTAPKTLAAPVIDVTDAVQLRQLHCRLPVIENDRALGEIPTPGSIGLRVKGARNCIFHMRKTRGFEDAVQQYSNDNLLFTSYNTFHFQEVVDANKNCIHLKTEASGWVNECWFYGGQFAQYAEDTAAFPTAAVRITKIGAGGNNPPNGHKFYGGSMEGQFTQTIIYDLDPGVATGYFSTNCWYGVRMEQASSVQLSLYALYDTFENCSGLGGAATVGGIRPPGRGPRYWLHTTDISGIPGTAGFRTNTAVPLMQANNSGAAAAFGVGIDGRINGAWCSNGDLGIYHPTDPAKLFPLVTLSNAGGIPRLRLGGGTTVGTDEIRWTNTGDIRVNFNFNTLTAATYDLGTAVQTWRNLYLSGSVGFYGAAPVAKQTLAATATDPATTQALVNDIRAKLIAIGLMS